jgi:hypothetical protein
MQEVLKSNFDCAVIGSSPLMLMQAIKLARNGKSVVVLEAEESIGGLWRMAILPDGTRIECACHLIDDIPGAYEVLQDYSGVEFSQLEPQPQSTDTDGRIRSYVSRTGILKNVLSDHGRVLKLLKKRLLGQTSTPDIVALNASLVKLHDFYCFNFKKLFTGSRVKAPKFGFVQFMDGLIANTRAAGAKIVYDKVMRVEKNDGCWLLILRSGEVCKAKRIDCSASATLRHLGYDEFLFFEANHKSCINLVASVLSTNLVKKISYISFANSEIFSRAARLDYPERKHDRHDYLFQLKTRNELLNDDEVLRHAADLFVSIGVIETPEHLTFGNLVMMSVREHSTDQQLPDGEILPNFHVHSSLGNLASGVAFWHRPRRRTPWQKFMS